eukprot:TRINITY_DN5410_c0_g1_i1.p2 TRINITY_DN5410_c0_g1~~TRINITY_DN5410_c0_g1_i1.p2  ORF type:complete len:207 (-),score=49.09 TRINITY_DN5410_c0_g1_i1:95-715(-)
MSSLLLAACFLSLLLAANCEFFTYSKCDKTWAEDVIFSHNGTRPCQKPPGCIRICGKVCWEGTVQLCESKYGDMITTLAMALTQERLPCGEAKCTPRALNKYLKEKNGYEGSTIVNLKKLDDIGLGVRAVGRGKDAGKLIQAKTSGKIVIVETRSGEYLLTEVHPDASAEGINAKGEKVSFNLRDALDGFILQKINDDAKLQAIDA